MKKTTFIQRIITVSFVLFAFVLLTGCEAEKEYFENSPQNGVKIERVTLNAVSKSNYKLVEVANKIKNMKFENSQSVAAKIVQDSLSGIFFNDENGLYIASEGKHSYTFPVLQLNPNDKVANVCFNSNQSGSYDVLLVEYDFTKGEYPNLSEAQLAEKQTKFTALVKNGLPVTTMSYVCIEIVAWVTYDVVPINEGDLTGEHGNEGGSGTWVTIASECFFTNDSGSGNGDGWNNGLGNGNGGTGNGGNDGLGGTGAGTILTGSIIDDMDNFPTDIPVGALMMGFENTLTPEQLTVLNANPKFRDFLIISNFSPSSLDFINTLIKDIIEDPNTSEVAVKKGLVDLAITNNTEFEIRPENDTNNSLVFNDLSELEDYLGENESEPGVEHYEEITNQEGRFANFKFNIKYGGGILVKAKIVETFTSYTIENVTSSLYGLSFFSEWEQNDFIVTYLPNHKIKIVVAGSVTTAGFLDGIGLGITENYMLTVIYDTSSGIVDSSNWQKI